MPWASTRIPCPRECRVTGDATHQYSKLLMAFLSTKQWSAVKRYIRFNGAVMSVPTQHAAGHH